MVSSFHKIFVTCPKDFFLHYYYYIYCVAYIKEEKGSRYVSICCLHALSLCTERLHHSLIKILTMINKCYQPPAPPACFITVETFKKVEIPLYILFFVVGVHFLQICCYIVSDLYTWYTRRHGKCCRRKKRRSQHIQMNTLPQPPPFTNPLVDETRIHATFDFRDHER